jgi:hypothetical protein
MKKATEKKRATEILGLVSMSEKKVGPRKERGGVSPFDCKGMVKRFGFNFSVRFEFVVLVRCLELWWDVNGVCWAVWPLTTVPLPHLCF